MPRIRPLEVRALLPLLEQDWDTPEELAEALIAKLDEARASRTSYVGVIQIGKASDNSRIVLGVGPYPGRASARKALLAHPARSLASACVIAQIQTPQGFEQMMRELDEYQPEAG